MKRYSKTEALQMTPNYCLVVAKEGGQNSIVNKMKAGKPLNEVEQIILQKARMATKKVQKKGTTKKVKKMLNTKKQNKRNK